MDPDYLLKTLFKKKSRLHFTRLLGSNIFQIMVLYLKKKIDIGTKKRSYKIGQSKTCTDNQDFFKCDRLQNCRSKNQYSYPFTTMVTTFMIELHLLLGIACICENRNKRKTLLYKASSNFPLFLLLFFFKQLFSPMSLLQCVAVLLQLRFFKIVFIAFLFLLKKMQLNNKFGVGCCGVALVYFLKLFFIAFFS